MGWAEVVSIAGGIIGTMTLALASVLWFLLRGVISDMRALEKDLNGHKQYAAENYTRNSDFRESVERIHDCIDSIERTVNSMAVNVATIAEKLNHKGI